MEKTGGNKMGTGMIWGLKVKEVGFLVKGLGFRNSCCMEQLITRD